MSKLPIISGYSDQALVPLCQRLGAESSELDRLGARPVAQVRHLAESGVFAWFVPQQFGGVEWKESDILRGYLQLSSACLTSAFTLTQLTGSIKRLVHCENDKLKREWLPELAAGGKLATVGISHLTTSRQHARRPVLSANQVAGGYLLNGFSPWITASTIADVVMTGAALENGSQLLAWIPMQTAGVRCVEPQQLVALNASCTGQVYFDDVFVADDWLLSSPAANIMITGRGVSTGGLQTSTLALGLATAASRFVAEEAARRDDLQNAAKRLQTEIASAVATLLSLADDSADASCSAAELRSTANSLVLRSTQSALVAAKGAGYVQGHPVGRWCREALFFLVWSCPQPVSAANLCEFARIE